MTTRTYLVVTSTRATDTFLSTVGRKPVVIVHDTRECPVKDDQIQHPCATCKKVGKDGTGHSTSICDCPVYVRAVQDSVRRTDYGC